MRRRPLPFPRALAGAASALAVLAAAPAGEAAFPGKDGRIAVGAGRRAQCSDSSGDLVRWRTITLSPSGKGLQRLGAMQENVAPQPAWSPSGRLLATVLSRWSPALGTSLSGIATGGSDGRPDAYAVTPGYDDLGTPSWSPDGAEIAYARDSIDQSNQYGERLKPYVNVGQRSTGVSRTLIRGVSPAWGKGDRILYDGPRGIGVVRSSGAGARLLTRRASDQDPSLSPAATQFAWSRGGAIYAARVAGGRARRLTSPPRGWADAGPAWSPSGRFVAFVRRRARPRLCGAADAALMTVAPASRISRTVRRAKTAGYGDLADPDWQPRR
jgi:Tol biopolymer transport system component